MSSTIPEIEDIAIDESFQSSGDFIGTELVLHEASFRDGTYGEFAAITATTPDGETVVLSNGSEAVLRQLKQVAAKDGFPVRATLVRVNNPKTGRQFMRFASPSKVKGLSPEGVLLDS